MAKTKPTSPNDSGFRSEPYTGAGAGWGSIKSSLAHVQRELGMARGIGLLAQVNQK
jgi:hypothetical protein